MLITARNITKSYPANTLFEGVSITVHESERIGLIGPNGSGKSTLLKILAGLIDPDDGEVTRNRGLRAIYVEQDDRFEIDATPLSAIESCLPHDDSGLDPATRASITLSKLGFDDHSQPVTTLSGGWKKRLALARALAQDPELLLLDEPTNHLDLEGVLWLEQFVKQVSIAIVYITHDRRFLENTATRIIELSKAYPGGSFEVAGNYTEFVKRKDAFLDAQIAEQTSIASKVRRDTAWLNQGIQGRQTRNKTQVQAAAARRQQLQETMDRNAAPAKTAAFAFRSTNRKTKKLLTLTGVSRSMGNKELFTDLNLTLTPGQRIGLLGVNGSGKTTLMRLVSGDLEPDTGSVQRADDLQVVTFSQHRHTLNQEHTLHEALCPYGEMVDYHGQSIHVSGWASRFLFKKDQLKTPIKNLSGGEQARVLIANLSLLPADVLLLDEPTNDLDIPSLEVLEQSLMEFTGAIMLVTHDRFLLERVSTEYLALDNQGSASLFASIEQWQRAQETAQPQPDSMPSANESTKPTQVSSKSTKLSYKYQLEYDGMEEQILEAETAVEELEAQAADPNLVADHQKAAVVYEQLKDAQTRVAELYARWSELEQMQSSGS
ncbi:MAG: ABC-F family ATP-binding cassette domain-containing protein [Phycisphaerales bacterium]|nr:ABC-F family ATP-binding cassette domain-containing protein [Phycisphaerales bacterium]